MKLFTALFGTETNTFSPFLTGFANFEQSYLERGGAHGEQPRNCQHSGGKQHKHAVRDRPADELCDHLPETGRGRALTPDRLASESIRNCPEATIFSPSDNPARISVWPLASAPMRTSAGL